MGNSAISLKFGSICMHSSFRCLYAYIHCKIFFFLNDHLKLYKIILKTKFSDIFAISRSVIGND